MKTALKLTCGTILAVSMITPAFAETTFLSNSAVHVNGTWTQATQNGLSFGDLFDFGGNFKAIFGYRRATFVNPNINFDWGLGFSYHFQDTQTRVFFHYDRFNDGHRRAVAHNNLLNLGITGGDGVGVVHDRLNEFSLGLDRRLAFGPCYAIHAAFFLEWDRLYRNFFERIVSDEIRDENTILERNTHNKFEGFGPGIGIKGRGAPFFCWPNVGVFATFTGSMLYGRNHFHSESFADDFPFIDLHPNSTRSIVNKVDITFGVDYKGIFKFDCDRVQLSLALGMRYLNYINVFKNGNTFFNLPYPRDLSYAANTGLPEDWGRFGPFLQFRIGGENA